MDRNIFDDLSSAFNINVNNAPPTPPVVDIQDDVPQSPLAEPDAIPEQALHERQKIKKGSSRLLNKNLRMQGKSYKRYKKNEQGISSETNQRPARFMGKACGSPTCAKSSAYKCNEISEPERQFVFERFWGTMNWSQRKVYVSSLVDREPSKRKRTAADISRRQYSCTYHLVINGERKQVCKKMFCRTIGFGEKQVATWIKAGAENARMHQHTPKQQQIPKITAEKRKIVQDRVTWYKVIT